MTKKPNRRVFLSGVAASSVASTDALASDLGEMPKLIAAHRASRVRFEEVQEQWLRVQKEYKEKFPDLVLVNMAIIDNIHAGDDAQKKAFGLSHAEQIFSEISAAETDALQAICSHVCRNHEEEKLRAEYLISEKIIDELEITNFSTILHSLIGDGADS